MYRRLGHLSLPLLFVIAGCASDAALHQVPDQKPSDDPAVSTDKGVFDASDPEAVKLASDLAEGWLSSVDNPEMAGVQDFDLKTPEIDHLGMAHVRVQQTEDGVPVFGGEGIVHIHPDGSITFTNAMLPDFQIDTVPELSSDDAIAVAGSVHTGKISSVNADLMIRREGDHLVWRVQIDDFKSDTPSRPVMFVDAKSGDVLWQYDNLQTAKSRKTYSSNNGTSLPGTLKRSEGSGDIGDIAVDDAHNFAGSVYDYYKLEQGRDSFDGSGGTLISSAHYSNNYDNAYWNGSQMVYGDGGPLFFPLSEAIDVVAHELTHAVTERTAGLVYSGESGGLNEGTSDIMGATVEAYSRGWPGDADTNTWKVGEAIAKSSSLGGALRDMSNPPFDGSIDNYANYTSGLDVHYSSGIANKAFYLMAQDSSLTIEQAADIWYRALTVYFTSSETFAQARTGTISAATDLFGASSAQVTAVGSAWSGVGVGPPLTFTVFDTKSSLSGATGAKANFQFNTPSGATAVQFKISGGSGDADMYVKFGSAPTTSSYDCRPYLTGNTETCTMNPAKAGTYYVMLNGFAAYSGVTLTAGQAGGSTPPPPPTTETNCTDGVDNDADGKTDCSDSDCSSNSACSASSCPGGTFVGTLSSTNTGDTYQYTAAAAGLYSATLSGPSGTDFDLYLEYQSGTRWRTRASSTGTTSTESVNYNEASTVLHRWNVSRWSGTGDYTLCVKQ